MQFKQNIMAPNNQKDRLEKKVKMLNKQECIMDYYVTMKKKDKMKECKCPTLTCYKCIKVPTTHNGRAIHVFL